MSYFFIGVVSYFFLLCGIDGVKLEQKKDLMKEKQIKEVEIRE